jgi:SAM-dependent methyltransferase
MTGIASLRRPYQGLVQIFEYNRPFYLRTIVGVMAAIVVSLYVPWTLRILILCAVAAAIFWMCSSLLVSHYVYDRSDLYGLGWLPARLSQAPRRWLNIHAGVDESSLAIRDVFPGSQGQVIDIYDPQKMTEPSIRRARRLGGVTSQAASGVPLPVMDDEFDAVFVIFAAHELREHDDQVRLLRQVARVLRGGGEAVLVEHLRDWANFVAFGPGFLHFFSKGTWEAAANAAGLPIRRHTTVTPFVHVFVLRK